MTTLFSLDSKIATRLLPLLAMREYPSPARTKLSQKMGQFMAESAIDFGRMLTQPWVQRNEFLAIISAARGRFEP